jgi:hypothetical protein
MPLHLFEYRKITCKACTLAHSAVVQHHLYPLLSSGTFWSSRVDLALGHATKSTVYRDLAGSLCTVFPVLCLSRHMTN